MQVESPSNNDSLSNPTIVNIDNSNAAQIDVGLALPKKRFFKGSTWIPQSFRKISEKDRHQSSKHHICFARWNLNILLFGILIFFFLLLLFGTRGYQYVWRFDYAAALEKRINLNNNLILWSYGSSNADYDRKLKDVLAEMRRYKGSSRERQQYAMRLFNVARTRAFATKKFLKKIKGLAPDDKNYTRLALSVIRAKTVLLDSITAMHALNKEFPSKKRRKKLLPLKKRYLHSTANSIFVSVASFRDEQCSNTIFDMYQKARNPHAVFVGVAEQHFAVSTIKLDSDVNNTGPSSDSTAPLDLPCVPYTFLSQRCQMSAFCPVDNIRVRTVSPRSAKGPTFGRYLSFLLYRGERYVLMIDSHMRFVKYWDLKVVSMHQATAQYNSVPLYMGGGGLLLRSPSGKRKGSPGRPNRVILSHYPLSWDNPEENKENRTQRTAAPMNLNSSLINFDNTGFEERKYFLNSSVDFMHKYERFKVTSHQCKAKLLNWGAPRQEANIAKLSNRPFVQAWAAAGFLFSDSSLLRSVPFDPYLDFVFDGEEAHNSLRAYFAGFNIYSPSDNIAFHYYYRYKSLKFWDMLPSNVVARRDVGQNRILYVIGARKTNPAISDSNDPDMYDLRIPYVTAPSKENLQSMLNFSGLNRTLDFYDKPFATINYSNDAYFNSEVEKEKKTLTYFTELPAVNTLGVRQKLSPFENPSLLFTEEIRVYGRASYRGEEEIWKVIELDKKGITNWC